jgi:hypothetical protein
MTKKEYEQLKSWNDDPNQTLEDYGEKSSDFYKFMVSVFDRTGDPKYCDEVIRSTDGCSDVVELTHFYGLMSHQDTSDDYIYDEISERLSSDENFCDNVLKEYIRCNY